MENKISRGDVFLVDFGVASLCEQGGLRPAVVIQNDVGNKFSPTIIMAAITSKQSKKPMPTHLSLSKEQYDTPDYCTILLEQVKTIDKRRIVGDKLFSLNDMDMIRLDRAIKISMGVQEPRETQAKLI